VFALRDLPDELTAAGMLLALDAIWRRVTDPAHRQRRLVVVDEAWQLMRSDAGAKFLYRLAKTGRKHWCGLTTVTQDIDDLLATNLGKAVIANAATQILLGQAPQAIGALTETFNPSEGERAFLLAARRGEGILTAGQQRVAFHAEASPLEDDLARLPRSSLQLSRLRSGAQGWMGREWPGRALGSRNRWRSGIQRARGESRPHGCGVVVWVSPTRTPTSSCRGSARHRRQECSG
jgi:hypothetical protein